MVMQVDYRPSGHNDVHDQFKSGAMPVVRTGSGSSISGSDRGKSSISNENKTRVSQVRAKSSSSYEGSRRSSTVSKGLERPTTTASLASSFMTGSTSRRILFDNKRLGVVTADSDEGRLSRCLKSWMPDYEIRSLPPQPYPPREAVFSARLGENVRIKRSDSTESIATQLSLFSTSSHGSNAAAQAAAAARSRRRRRRQQKEMSDELGIEPQEEGKRSIWVELASKRGGALDKMLRMHAMYAQLDTETEIYRRLPDHEKVMVTDAGTKRGIRLGPGRQRSDSASNVYKKIPLPKPISLSNKLERERRVQSAGAKPRGPFTNFHELRRQFINQRLATMQEKFSRHRHSSRRSHGTRSMSRLSPSSMGSNNDVFASNTPRDVPISDLESIRNIDGEQNNDEDIHVSVWKGDSQILAIDLQRGLTAKVKSKITSTTSALERATGYGDDNNLQIFVGPLEEYPHLIEQDFSFIAKIPQRVRISPQLSEVIRTDIHVRMGRPRYHEIRTHDLEIWNQGTDLDRSHRNLKVFNWLHSLRETDFDMSLPEGILDEPPGGSVTTKDEVVVAVDEPKIKPLFERLKRERYIV